MPNIQRVKLTRNLFMSLQPGHYIMDNYIPQHYEEIGLNLQKQWEKWRGKNGRTVNLYESKSDCLRDWWKNNSVKGLRSKSKALYRGALNKQIFMDAPDGYHLLFTQDPYPYFELSQARDAQWFNYKKWNGLSVMLFKNYGDCVMERNNIFE